MFGVLSCSRCYGFLGPAVEGTYSSFGYMMPQRSLHFCSWSMLGSRWWIGHKCVEGGPAGRGRSCNVVRWSIAEQGERKR